MTKPSYEELRITKHSGSPQIADSACGDNSWRTVTTIRERARTRAIEMIALLLKFDHIRESVDMIQDALLRERREGIEDASRKVEQWDMHHSTRLAEALYAYAKACAEPDSTSETAAEKPAPLRLKDTVSDSCMDGEHEGCDWEGECDCGCHDEGRATL